MVSVRSGLNGLSFTNKIGYRRVLKNKHQAVRQGSISSKLKAPSSKEKIPSAQLSAFSL
jgi:hypothetical protein